VRCREGEGVRRPHVKTIPLLKALFRSAEGLFIRGRAEPAASGPPRRLKSSRGVALNKPADERSPLCRRQPVPHSVPLAGRKGITRSGTESSAAMVSVVHALAVIHRLLACVEPACPDAHDARQCQDRFFGATSVKSQAGTDQGERSPKFGRQRGIPATTGRRTSAIVVESSKEHRRAAG
jgi:hypothetical protein